MKLPSLFTFNSYQKKGIFSYYKDIFAFMEKINSKVIRIHIGSLPTFPTDIYPKNDLPERDLLFYKEMLDNNLQIHLKIADNQFIICIENYKFNSAILKVLDSYLKKRNYGYVGILERIMILHIIEIKIWRIVS